MRKLKQPEVRTAIEQEGASIRFLPPYSPDFNPIDLAFAKLKAFLRAAPPRRYEQVCHLIAIALDLDTRGRSRCAADACGAAPAFRAIRQPGARPDRHQNAVVRGRALEVRVGIVHERAVGEVGIGRAQLATNQVTVEIGEALAVPPRRTSARIGLDPTSAGCRNGTGAAQTPPS